MEKFFIVSPNCRFYKRYLDYQEMSKKIHDAFGEFAKQNDFETHEYYQYTNDLYICPTDNDIKRFGKYFKKDKPGLFKKNSPLAKEWIAKCRTLKLETPYKPSTAFEFCIYGRTSSRLFMINNILYTSLNAPSNFENINGFEEIKASDFFNVIEEYEESLKS